MYKEYNTHTQIYIYIYIYTHIYIPTNTIISELGLQSSPELVAIARQLWHHPWAPRISSNSVQPWSSLQRGSAWRCGRHGLERLTADKMFKSSFHESKTLIRGPLSIKYSKIRVQWIFGQPFLKPCLKTLLPFELESEQKNKSYLKVPEIQKSRMAQMIDFFTKPIFKNAQNQSRKGDSLEAP